MTPPSRNTTCKEFVELITAYLDDALAPEDRTRFEQHPERCLGCRAYMKQFRMTLGALSTAATETLEPAHLDELVRAYLALKPRESENAEWLAALQMETNGREAALSRLHQLLLRAARAEAVRRLDSLPDAVRADLDDLCTQTADDALVAVMDRLESFRGDSRFTTWAYQFAIFHVSSRLRRHAWRGYRAELDEHAWSRSEDRGAPNGQTHAETRELLELLRKAVTERLTDRQRLVFEAAVLQEVPIDVLAQRMRSTRGAIYKTLHDARLKLRAELVAAGYPEFEP